MVITSFRSGSSFLGDLLQQSDARSYYYYEPLHFLTPDVRIKRRHRKTAKRVIQHLFQCNYEAEPRFRKRILGERTPYFLTRNSFVANVCNNTYPDDRTCGDVHLLQEICRRSRVQIMKFTRLNLKDVLKLQLPPGTQILYLQRDPRAIYSSRKSRPWCHKKECMNTSVLCNERNSDFSTLQKFSDKPITVTRFEDLAQNPMQESERLFNALGLQYTDNVKKFLRAHTEVSKKISGPYSTRRNSSAVISQWKTQLSRKEIMDLQEHCEYVLHNAGYDFIP